MILPNPTNTTASPHTPPGTSSLTSTIFILRFRFTIKATTKTLRLHTQKTEKNIELLLDN